MVYMQSNSRHLCSDRSIHSLQKPMKPKSGIGHWAMNPEREKHRNTPKANHTFVPSPLHHNHRCNQWQTRHDWIQKTKEAISLVAQGKEWNDAQQTHQDTERWCGEQGAFSTAIAVRMVQREQQQQQQQQILEEMTKKKHVTSNSNSSSTIWPDASSIHRR
eukprot:215531_1